jgi:hypothetical protein
MGKTLEERRHLPLTRFGEMCYRLQATVRRGTDPLFPYMGQVVSGGDARKMPVIRLSDEGEGLVRNLWLSHYQHQNKVKQQF